MNERAHKIIQFHLKPKAVNYDIQAFKEYYDFKIELKDVKYRWKVNNQVPYEDYDKISDKDFREWLESLGWWR